MLNNIAGVRIDGHKKTGTNKKYTLFFSKLTLAAIVNYGLV
jgi:hypothetical protein